MIFILVAIAFVIAAVLLLTLVVGISKNKSNSVLSLLKAIGVYLFIGVVFYIVFNLLNPVKSSGDFISNFSLSVMIWPLLLIGGILGWFN